MTVAVGDPETVDDRRASHRNPRPLGRRAALAAVATGLVGSVAGCAWEPSFPDADVIAGPDGALVFEPAAFSVPVGESVTWGFPTSGHNVCCRPGDSDEVALPAGAESFASYGSDESPHGSLVPRGGTFEHVFEFSGRYVYTCIPHEPQGMLGTVTVE